MRKNEKDKNESLIEWRKVLEPLFDDLEKEHKEWTDLNEIASVLNKVGTSNSRNHMFLPDGGGIDMIGSEKYYLPDYIKLITSGGRNPENGKESLFYPIILRPEKLVLEHFNEDNYEWTYLRIATKPLEVQPEKNLLGKDILTKNIVMNEEEVTKILGGDIIIFNKYSTYNYEIDDYDGKFNRYSVYEFRNYIEKLWDRYRY
jgi:serine/threonine-protein kinase